MMGLLEAQQRSRPTCTKRALSSTREWSYLQNTHKQHSFNARQET